MPENKEGPSAPWKSRSLEELAQAKKDQLGKPKSLQGEEAIRRRRDERYDITTQDAQARLKTRREEPERDKRHKDYMDGVRAKTTPGNEASKQKLEWSRTKGIKGI